MGVRILSALFKNDGLLFSKLALWTCGKKMAPVPDAGLILQIVDPEESTQRERERASCNKPVQKRVGTKGIW